MDLSPLERKLGYPFRNRAILKEACRHSSYVNENPRPGLRDNERLEFLGDAVLSLAVGDMLMKRYPDLPEGDLSRMRATLVCEAQLAALAERISLGQYLQLGRGECQNNGRGKASILADAFEAVIAAVYLDGGFEAAFKLIRRHFKHLLGMVVAPAANRDYKSRLQELVQNRHHQMPVYAVVDETGPDHDKTFQVRIEVCGLTLHAKGKNKKMAEQNAAHRALSHLVGDA